MSMPSSGPGLPPHVKTYTLHPGLSISGMNWRRDVGQSDMGTMSQEKIWGREDCQKINEVGLFFQYRARENTGIH